MLIAPIPDNESERLAALRRYCVLDTLPEPAFDRLTHIVQHILQVPTVLVSLVDEDRQWFKSKLGLAAAQTPRDISFCGHAVYHREVLVVPDAALDARFADNPLVTGDLGLRFYAGAPLINAEGHALGTLCAIDYKPRPAPTAGELDMLRKLADAVVGALELRRHAQVQTARMRQSAALGLIAAAANQAKGLIDVLGPVLAQWCDYTDLTVGHVYVAGDEGSQAWVSSGVWHVRQGHALETLIAQTAPMSADADDEMLVQVLRSGRPLFVTDLAAQPGARARAARAAGMHSAVLIPITAGKRVMGVIECFGQAQAWQPEDWLDAADYVSLQLSRLAERERADRLKDDFVNTVSHELRTPLTSIGSALELLESGRGGALPAKASRMVQIAHRNSQRLTRLVNDILDVSKLESDKLKLDQRPLNLAELIERAMAETEGFAQGFDVGLAFASEHTQACALVDEDRFIQVVINLLSNAVKFSPAGEQVQVGLTPHGASWRLSVADRGPGIPQAFQARIFEKFAQAAQPVNRQSPGTGLGLAIVQRIVRMHGGEVGFETAPDLGTTFHVDLPAWRGAP